MLDAAASLFMAHGYGAVSMDAVARAAGVSKATLYAHFSSKDQLFATIIGEACRQKIALAELLPADATDLRAALAAFGGRLLRFFLEERPLALHRVVICGKHAVSRTWPGILRQRTGGAVPDVRRAGSPSRPRQAALP